MTTQSTADQKRAAKIEALETLRDGINTAAIFAGKSLNGRGEWRGFRGIGQAVIMATNFGASVSIGINPRPETGLRPQIFLGSEVARAVEYLMSEPPAVK